MNFGTSRTSFISTGLSVEDYLYTMSVNFDYSQRAPNNYTLHVDSQIKNVSFSSCKRRSPFPPTLLVSSRVSKLSPSSCSSSYSILLLNPYPGMVQPFWCQFVIWLETFEFSPFLLVVFQRISRLSRLFVVTKDFVTYFRTHARDESRNVCHCTSLQISLSVLKREILPFQNILWNTFLL